MPSWLSKLGQVDDFVLQIKETNYDSKSVVSMLRQITCGVSRSSVDKKKKLKDNSPHTKIPKNETEGGKGASRETTTDTFVRFRQKDLTRMLNLLS